jgi:uncharacterized Zn-finger protein
VRRHAAQFRNAALVPTGLPPLKAIRTTKDAAMPTQAPETQPETQTVTTWKVACDGGDGALGHPRVWLTIPADTGFVECGYCDKRYVIDRDHAHDDH